jgi:hypothetical protein
VGWLSEAILHTRNEASLPLSQLRQHPMLFPFTVSEIDFGFIKRITFRQDAIVLAGRECLEEALLLFGNQAARLRFSSGQGSL